MVKVTAATLGAEPFLRGMPSRYLERLAEAATDVVVPARHRIFEEGGYATGFWLIRSGPVVLDVHVPGHGLAVVETLGMGDVLGWSWLLPPYQWTLGAITTGPSEVFGFDGARVRTLLDGDPQFAYELTRRFLAVLANRLQATRVRLLDPSLRPEARA